MLWSAFDYQVRSEILSLKFHTLTFLDDWIMQQHLITRLKSRFRSLLIYGFGFSLSAIPCVFNGDLPEDLNFGSDVGHVRVGTGCGRVFNQNSPIKRYRHWRTEND